MGIRENKATVERCDRLTGACKLDALDEICTPDMVNHALASHRPPGLAGTKQFLAESESDPVKAVWRRSMMFDQQLVAVAEGDYVIQLGKRAGTWPGGTLPRNRHPPRRLRVRRGVHAPLPRGAHRRALGRAR
ncbi:MAG TPA: hypothetical protein VIX82_16545 [Solirubrobacteraceae bacterium]